MKSTPLILAALAVPAVLGIAPAHATPALPASCTPAAVVDGICTARLASVTADVINGTITGTPIGGTEAVTLAGPAEAYLKSEGFGVGAPEAVRTWDTTIDQVGGLPVDPNNPNWYGNAKARVFMSRTLNDLATQFPPDTLVVRFVADDAQPYALRLVSIQPVAE